MSTSKLSEPSGLLCPFCGQPALLVIGDAQAFCGNDACPCLMWNPLASAAEARRQVRIIDEP